MKVKKSLLPYACKAAAVCVLALAGTARAADWNGSVSTDWNNATNWSTGVVPSGVGAVIGTTSPNIATILNNVTGTPTEIVIGGWGSVGRVDHLAGSLSTQTGGWPPGWILLGFGPNGNGTYNLADTASTGGAFTGFGTGSGTLNILDFVHMGEPFGDGTQAGSSVLNINTTGALNISGNFNGARQAYSARVNMDAGSLNVGGELWLAAENATTNVFNQSGGTVSSRYWMVFSRYGGAQGTYNMTGGIANVATNGGNVSMVSQGSNGVAVLNVSGGSFNTPNNLWVVEGYDTGGNGTLNISGNGSVNVGGEVNLISASANTTGMGTVNLHGGTLRTTRVTKTGSGTGTFNFNGGVLQPMISTATFMQGLTTADIQSGGAIIDTTNLSVTIAQTLQGVGGLTKLGSGLLGLGGGYVFSGPALVLAGALALDAAQASPGNAITVSNASLNLLLNNGNSSIYAGAVTFAGNSTLNLNFGTAASPIAPAITAISVNVTGTNTINITGPSLVAGLYPLIYTGGSVPTNNFKLGVLPTGLAAVLTDSGTALSLLVTASGQNLTWYGADSVGNVLTNWDVNTSSNWNAGAGKYLQYAGNAYGDNVLFDDNLYLQQGTNVNLAGRVVPSTITVNSTLPYSITGTGGIDGGGELLVGLMTSSFFLGTSNNFTGGAIISGRLIVTNDAALGASSNVVDLASGTLQISGSTTSSRPFTVSSNSTISVDAGVNAQLNGAFVNSATPTISIASGGAAQLGGTMSGTGGLTKNGAGTLTVTGNLAPGGGAVINDGTNAVTGGLAVAAGQLQVSSWGGHVTRLDVETNGVASANDWFVVGIGGSTSTINVNGGTLIHRGGGSMTLATFGSTGTINLNSGSISNLSGEFYLGEGTGGTADQGFYNQNGGYATLGNFYVGHGSFGGQNGIGVANVTGGTLDLANLEIGYGNDNTRVGTNVMTIGSGATVNASGFVRLGFAGTNELWGVLTNNGGTLNVGSTALYLSYWPDGCSGHVTHNSGALNLRNSASIVFAQNGAQVSENDFVQNGGAVTFYSDAGVTVGGTGSLNLGNSGSATNTYTLAGGTLTVPRIQLVSGMGTFNFGAGRLVAAAGSTNFMQGLTAANVMSAGATIDSAGHNITIAQPLLAGGGSGGLTKLGNGTLLLNGVNTYTGTTLVSAGTLGGIGAIAGPVVIGAGAGLAPGDSIGTLVIGGNLTLEAGSTSTFEVDGTTLTSDQVAAGANVTYGGVLRIVPSGALTAGQQFTLFSGAGAINSGNFSSVQSTQAGATFSFTNGVLTVVSAGPSAPAHLTNSYSAGVLSLAWPAGQGWRLQMQTNSLSVGLGANWGYVTDGSVSSTNITVDSAKPSVFFRLTYP